MLSIDPPLFPIRLRHVGGGSTVIDQRWCYRLHAAHWRLYRNRDSGAWIDHPGGRMHLQPGRFCWLPAWGDFQSGCRGKVRHLFLHVAVAGLEGDWERGLLALPQLLSEDRLLSNLADRCESSPVPGWAEALEHAAMTVWMSGLDAATAHALRAHLDAPDPLAPALRLIEENPAARHSVASLAQACGCSEDTFGRLMHRRLGRSPAAWVRRRRCACAAELLSNTNRDIEDIANASGFANRHHLSRVFSSIIGCGPATYRRQMKAWSG